MLLVRSWLPKGRRGHGSAAGLPRLVVSWIPGPLGLSPALEVAFPGWGAPHSAATAFDVEFRLLFHASSIGVAPLPGKARGRVRVANGGHSTLVSLCTRFSVPDSGSGCSALTDDPKIRRLDSRRT